MILRQSKENINIIIIYVTNMMIEVGDVVTEHYRNRSNYEFGHRKRSRRGKCSFKGCLFGVARWYNFETLPQTEDFRATVESVQ